MTEDEAKTKICCGPPMVGAAVLAHLAGSTQDEAFCRCIGSACMAWRWAGYRAENGSWVRIVATAKWDPANADGYCGLAGSAQ